MGVSSGLCMWCVPLERCRLECLSKNANWNHIGQSMLVTVAMFAFLCVRAWVGGFWLVWVGVFGSVWVSVHAFGM